ncbi:beta-lactamase family protein [Lentzea sp. PSKA42]|uniref:Beta-lactamase family protein n=1 Tax=Lentzea indica TaxID=2604800 RepID=A0ABX1FW48_9PSEU|nr:beta-lactamase family protein [Lentzea indica]
MVRRSAVDRAAWVNPCPTPKSGGCVITRRSLLGATVLAGAWVAAGSPATSVAGARSVADELSRFVTDLADRGQFSGTVQLDHRGSRVFSAAHGLANRATGTSNTAATRFTAASIGKFLTGVAAARIVQNGLMAFGTTLGEAVPRLRNTALHPLTLHQLLTHTAALPAVSPGAPPGARTGRAVDYLPVLETLQLAGRPGERWSYTNAGFLRRDDDRAGCLPPVLVRDPRRHPHAGPDVPHPAHPARTRRSADRHPLRPRRPVLPARPPQWCRRPLHHRR